MTELSAAADLAWKIAALEARRGHAPAIGTDHLLIGLLSLEKLLEPAAGLDPAERETVRQEHEALVRLMQLPCLPDAATLRREIRRRIRRRAAATASSPHRDPDCRARFERGMMLARDGGNVPCGALHLLAAVLERPTTALELAMQSLTIGSSIAGRWREHVFAAIMPPRPGARTRRVVDPQQPPTPEPICERPVDLRPSSASFPVVDPEPGPELSPADPAVPVVPPVLLRYGRDLTAEAEAGRLGPVIGRHEEMLQVVRVLHRRTKNSPVLIGEAGVGKTAIVEGLAHRISEGTILPGRRIVALSLPSVVAGTTYRGQFEERIEEILAALRARPDVILFLDELHTIVGAGNSEGRLDAANTLKPALARGEIACIGATTTDEYRRHVESDPALERRFQPVPVGEPSPAEARTILAGLCPELERHHAVTIETDALDAAVALTVRYVHARRLPDKAVDALDEACTRARLPTLTLRTGGAEGTAQSVTRETVAEVVSAWTGIPLGRIEQAEADALTDLEARLGERVVGQADAIRQVAQRLRMARTGLTDPNRPAGVFLFLGPSGVGKTELALALADLVTAPSGQPGLIRLDMSEYAEKHHAARLIGAPPGYLGHDGEGQLTGPLRRSPHAVVLLDEAEKAHPDVFDLFLQLFDAGRLTDGQGRLVDGRSAIFVLTSNLIADGDGRRMLGFGDVLAQGVGRAAPDRVSSPPADHASLRARARAYFRPELLNRIDEVALFRPLGEGDLIEIARRRLTTLRRRLLDRYEVDAIVSPEALALLARRAAHGTGGARELQRVIGRLIEEPLSREILTGQVSHHARLLIEVRGESLHVTRDTQDRPSP